MVHYSNCPLCSSDKILLHLSPRDYFLSREEYKLFRCTDCGFIFTQDHPEEKDIGRYYESKNYLSHSETNTGLFSNIYRIARRVMLGRRVRMVSKLSGLKKGMILDIGSGSGYFLSAMKEAGWEVKGIEINDEVRQSSISKFGLDILDPLQIQTLRTGSFDCITLWHVLEHLNDLSGYAREIQRLLKPGGVCIIALPNCGSYDADHFGIFWAAYDVPRHLWHFTPDSFKYFIEKTGFEIIAIKSLPLDVYFISVLSEKYKSSGFYFIPGIIKGFWFTLKTLFNKNRSSSMIYFIKKKAI
jgi:2-polyprenyl-3-methyl-5-hydroxy-6-metoxy-1,4-benzoquinol methylase